MLIKSILSYFILWLQDYRIRYAAWQKQCNSPDDAAFASTTASRLNMFYSRAKQTFFVPRANYELALSLSTLTFLYDQDDHPHPAIFCDAEKEVRRMLEQSLRRFIQSQLTNVGNRRALCGIIAGTVAVIAGFIPPMVTNLLGKNSRWLRLTALPGMILGLTILLSALHGVCLAVYIFGDVRQLRKFELSRPPAAVKTMNINRNFVSKPTPTLRHPQKAFSYDKLRRPSSLGFATSFPDAPNSYENQTTFSGMMEMNPIEGPSTCPILSEYCSNPENDAEWLHQRELYWQGERESEPAGAHSAPYGPTATFIAPFCSPSTTDISGYWDSEEMHSMNAHSYRLRAMEDVEKLKYDAPLGQPIADFDFDGLPPIPAKSSRDFDHGDEGEGEDEPQFYLDDKRSHRWEWFVVIISHIQARCSYKKWDVKRTSALGPALPGGVLSSKTDQERLAHVPSSNAISLSTDESNVSRKVKKRFRIVNAVPAFAVPITRVLDPVIIRAQWEIVIRSAGFALLISWAICGPLLAIPV